MSGYSPLYLRSRLYYVLLAASGLVALAGRFAVYLMEHHGHVITGMNNQVVWGLPHVFAIFLIVAASGVLNVASIGSVFGKAMYKARAPMASLLSIAMLAGGLAILMLDLARPDRLIVAATNSNFTSVFAWNVAFYGHLDRTSNAKLQAGQKVRKGKKFAAVGRADENGGWTPHLHFQLIVDLLDLGCDFPGVAQPAWRPVWLSLCPDPNLVLQIPSTAFPARVPSKDETLSQRHMRMGGNVSISYRSPLKIMRGWMQYLYDEQGRKYVDAYNNVAHVGSLPSPGCGGCPRADRRAQHQHTLSA